MKKIRVKINVPKYLESCIKYIWTVFTSHFKIEYSFVRNGSCDLEISDRDDCDIRISDTFIRMITENSYDHRILFGKEPLIYSSTGQPDYLGTAFYMINSLQEYGVDQVMLDSYGRFLPEASYQSRFGVMETDLVGKYFKMLTLEIPHLSSIAIPEKSRVFLSHDVDSINHGVFQEMKAAMKRGNPGLMLKILAENFLDKPSFLNMDQIMKIHDIHDFTSTFFWLVENKSHPSQYNPDSSIPNADYNIRNKRIIRMQDEIISHGFENGLHKSTGSHSFDQELSKLSFSTLANRNHYLLMQVPEHYEKLANSNIQLDFSLGFGPAFGHRNSYARPFVPYSLKDGRLYSFLEVPLQIMDTTFKYYHKLDAAATEKLVLTFLDDHLYDSVISILWHNDMFSPIKNPEWLRLYKLILEYLYENGVSSVTQSELHNTKEEFISSYHNNSL